MLSLLGPGGIRFKDPQTLEGTFVLDYPIKLTLSNKHNNNHSIYVYKVLIDHFHDLFILVGGKSSILEEYFQIQQLQLSIFQTFKIVYEP